MNLVVDVNYVEMHVIPALAILFFGLLLGAFCRRLLFRFREVARGKAMITFAVSAIASAIDVASIVIALSLLGVSTNVIIGGLSAVGVGISLALKDNMANVAGGVQILFTRPFKVGDRIKVDHYDGRVTRIELMFTVLLTEDNEDIFIPNARLVSQDVANLSQKMIVRVQSKISLSIDNDFDKVKDVLMEVIKNHPLVLQDQKNEVVISSFDDSSIHVSVFAWVDEAEYWQAFYSLHDQVHKACLENELIFSYTAVHMQ